MMRKFTTYIIYCALISSLFSCANDEDPLHVDYGYLNLNFSKAKDDVSITTKEEDPIFAVSITNSQGVIVKSVANHKTLENNPLKLKAGIYYIKATTGESVEAGFDKPFYEGKDTISVKSGAVENGNVICSLSNVIVNVQVDATVEDNFKEYYVTVTNGNSNGSLIFSNDNGTLNKNGYFACTGKLNWSLYLVNNNDNIYDGDVKGVITDVKPKQNYTLKFTTSSGEEGGAINISIICDSSMIVHNHEISIPLNKKAKPAFSTNGFVLGTKQSIPETSQQTWQVSVESKAGLKDLTLTHNSLAMSNMGVPYSFNIIGLDASTKSAVNAAGITWGTIEDGTVNGTIDFSSLVSTLVKGSYSIEITASDKQSQAVDASFVFDIVPDVETTALNAEPWAKHAFLYGIWNTESKPSGLGFEYKKASDTNWTQVTSGLSEDGSNYSVKITDLTPSTNYIFRAISSKEASNEIEFTTEAADQIPNMNFDTWASETRSTSLGSRTYDSPNISLSSKWWDSSNGGSCLANVYPVSPETSHVVKGKAAKVESKSALGVLAAGSVYLGEFGSTIGTSGAYLDFGRSYSCRPQSLHGYYDYSPASINKTKDPYTNLNGHNDYGQIYVLLTDWAAPFTVNTSEKVFVDFDNDAKIIAYGELTFDQSTNGSYKEFTIPLVYRNKRTPKYCVIVASSSKYGDYFTGGIGSILYIDEFEFIF